MSEVKCICHISNLESLSCPKHGLGVQGKRAAEAMQQNPILYAIINRGTAQTGKGIGKYGEAVNPANLSLLEWMEHEQQEAWDQMVYMECVMAKIREVVVLLENAHYHCREVLYNPVADEIKEAIDILQGI